RTARPAHTGTDRHHPPRFEGAMYRLSRPTFVVLIAAGLLFALSGWEHLADGLGLGPAPSHLLTGPLLHEAKQARRALDADMAVTMAREQRVRELAQELAEERLTLAEAAARLGDVYRAVPDFPWHPV